MDESATKKSKPDPNQFEFFMQKNEDDDTNLTHNLVETEDYKPEAGFLKALIGMLEE